MCLIMFDHCHHKGLMEYSLAMHLNFSLCVENDDYCLCVFVVSGHTAGTLQARRHHMHGPRL